MQVTALDGLIATCETGARVETVDLALTGPVPLGAWVLVFLGSAREVLDPETADQITRALNGLQAVLNGGDLGDAFADLENREPQLPPHLQPAND